jgi:pimeloyl-ACP methyl ester carboxylesterase
MTTDATTTPGAVPVVLVHGNPETDAVWEPVAARLGRAEVHRPNLPGFGCPTPHGFDATKESYVAWLVGRIEDLGRPVHLVGHDWGGALTVRVAETRPDLLVSWVSDAVGLCHPDYVWHDLAQVWQTPGDGEAAVEALSGLDPADAVAGFEALGIPHPQAVVFVDALDARMGDCVLRLYRSAVPELLAPWRTALADAARRPGLAVHATGDPYTGDRRIVTEAAAVAGAELATVEGLGHWWMLEDPTLAAELLAGWFRRHDGPARPR